MHYAPIPILSHLVAALPFLLGLLFSALQCARKRNVEEASDEQEAQKPTGGSDRSKRAAPIKGRQPGDVSSKSAKQQDKSGAPRRAAASKKSDTASGKKNAPGGVGKPLGEQKVGKSQRTKKSDSSRSTKSASSKKGGSGKGKKERGSNENASGRSVKKGVSPRGMLSLSKKKKVEKTELTQPQSPATDNTQIDDLPPAPAPGSQMLTATSQQMPISLQQQASRSASPPINPDRSDTLNPSLMQAPSKMGNKPGDSKMEKPKKRGFFGFFSGKDKKAKEKKDDSKKGSKEKSESRKDKKAREKKEKKEKEAKKKLEEKERKEKAKKEKSAKGTKSKRGSSEKSSLSKSLSGKNTVVTKSELQTETPQSFYTY
ncbi:unnamed protein product, partial [Mesorhabditis spiculigera]